MSARHRVADERGETLVEMLLAVAIMGIAAVALMAGLTTSVLMSDIHRKQATAGTAVRDYAEALQKYVADGHYVDNCLSTTSYGLDSLADTPGFHHLLVAGSMRYWSGTDWQPTCTTDTGLQKLTIRVYTDDDRASEQLVVVLRKPCRLGDDLCS
ncbi:prepilin-type N-terminal cleavage/methylation domain-containing protein [Kribbella voronezhensis]|uniref:Prepilin-type N-terminal cleavage/methylation domain-containing protein n=1 Tax=Kribbella voronezhensis TaxID=2512212 RepID=A0A4R7TJE4_9ACTN|nr:type II secretion system protein [Kribbella voronezhensis]TDU91677.1 prepilin-type N-terminal cleavage/methylation domain-containing protein [Kribbella voronezhensis]